jgi:hypothetical protein
MRNAVAQWILSLVTPKDRAGTILGDLLEAYPSSIAFWSSLLRSAISIGMHRPYRLLSNVLTFAILIGGYALWIWVFTRVIGVSLLLAVIVLILSELIGLWQRRRRAALPGARRPS